MKIIRLPADPRLVEGMVFDLDNTLYTNPAYAKYQEDVLVECLGRALGVGGDAARERIERMRAERRRAGLAPTSLGNLSAELGFDIATSVRWREENLDPGLGCLRTSVSRKLFAFCPGISLWRWSATIRAWSSKRV